jgi:hypothetical protein
MSKTIKVTYGVSIMMGEHWQKIDVEQLPDEGESMETVLDEVCERVKSWHKNKYPDMYMKDDKPLPDSGYNATQEKADKEWEEIKNKLAAIEFQEDAVEFINSTDFFLSIEAKKLINNKPLKNEKK